MLIKILYSLMLPTFLVVPFLYKSRRPAMLDFYRNMTISFAFRKVYTRMLLLFLLAFHFYHLTIFRNHYDLIPSSVLCFAMFSHGLCERCIYFLQERRALWAGMVLSLACLFIPHFMPLGVSIGVLLCGTVFYPPRQSKFMPFLSGLADYPESHDELMEIYKLYFRWDKSGSRRPQNPMLKRKHLLNDEIEDAEFSEIGHEHDDAQS